MTYKYNQAIIKERISRLNLAIIGSLLAIMAAVGLMTFAVLHASATTIEGCDFDDTTTPGVWSLQGDCTTSGPINITAAGTIVEGNGYTINAGYNFGSNPAGTNTVIGIINADDVTIKNLTIEGTGGLGLHGINVYVSENVTIQDVTVMNNDKSGLVVNGSTVSVGNFRTSGNGWHGINVDLGTGVTDPAVLNVDGPVDQSNEAVDIYVDNAPVAVTVNDPLGQYTYEEPVVLLADRLYTWSDVIAPEVEITSPAAGDVLSGSVTVDGEVTDFVANERQRLLVRDADNNVVYSEIVVDSSNPAFPSFNFDSSDYPDGEYRLVLVGIDTSDNRGRDVVRVTFDNYANTKDDCKQGGWERGVFGSSFRNQGDCVSYFATGGANPATNGATNERANRNR